MTREIQGLPVAAALDLLAFTPKKAAALVAKTLKSAIANAENNDNLRVDEAGREGGGRWRRADLQAISAEGPRQRRPDPQADQPHPDHSHRRDRDQTARRAKGEEKRRQEEAAAKPGAKKEAPAARARSRRSRR